MVKGWGRGMEGPRFKSIKKRKKRRSLTINKKKLVLGEKYRTHNGDF